MKVSKQKIAEFCDTISGQLLEEAVESGDSEILEIADQINSLGQQMMDGKINPEKVLRVIWAIYNPGSLN